MAKLEVLKYPDPLLKEIAVPVSSFDDELRTFVSDLLETMMDGPGAVGIAAPQVGRLQQIVIVDISSRPKHPNNGRMILINPEISSWEGMSAGREGCLSLPDYTGNVIRAERIELAAQDERGEKRIYRCEGFEARAVQHEMDHLEGILFIDRLVSRRNDLFKRKVYR
jgi:peptide deformylase